VQDSPFQKGEQMDILKEKIDANSFQTMKHIIFLTSTKNDKIRYFEKEEADKRFLPIGKEQKEEDAYTFQYPGEMLERYEEKIGDTVQIRRALAFALVTMSDFHEAQMYVGTQYENFLKRIEREAKTDIYLAGAMCFLTPSEKKQKFYYERIKSYSYKELAECMCILFLFKGKKEIWEMLKENVCSFFENERAVNIFQNAEMYIWFFRTYEKEIKKERKQIFSRLKLLVKMQHTHVKERSELFQQMRKAGYQKEEIFYLNLRMLQAAKEDKLETVSQITWERASESFCIFICNQEKEYSEELYQLCRELIQKHRSYEIKIGGYDGILGAMKWQVTVKNSKIYALLHTYAGERQANPSWFFIPSCKTQAKKIFSLLGKKDFDKKIRETLYNQSFTEQELQEYLKIYQELTDVDYIQQMLQEENYQNHKIFETFAEKNFLDPRQIIKELLTKGEGKAISEWEEPEKKKYGYILSYIEDLDTDLKFQTAKLLLDNRSMEEIRKEGKRNFLWKSVGIQEFYYRREYDKMNFLKLHLQPNQVLQLFFWIEESVYRFQPQKYFAFLLKVLEKEENFIWLPKEQAQEFWKKLMELGIEEAGSKKFRMLYMEKEEREKFYKEQEEAAKQKKVAELEKQTKEAYQHFWKLQQEKTAEEIFWKIDSLFYSYQKEAYIKATVQFLKKYLEKVGWKLPKAAIWEYLKLLLNLGKKEGIEIATIKEWLIKTEVEDAYDGEGTHGNY